MIREVFHKDKRAFLRDTWSCFQGYKTVFSKIYVWQIKDIGLNFQRYRNETSKIYDWKAKDIWMNSQRYSIENRTVTTFQNVLWGVIRVARGIQTAGRFVWDWTVADLFAIPSLADGTLDWDALASNEATVWWQPTPRARVSTIGWVQTKSNS